MYYLIAVLFGRDFASIRQGVTITQLRDCERECEGVDTMYAITYKWWEEQFQGRRGVPMGELLTRATDVAVTSDYMGHLIIATCHKARQK